MSRLIVQRSWTKKPISPITFEPVPPSTGAYSVNCVGTPLVKRYSNADVLVFDELRVSAHVSVAPTFNECEPVT